MIGSLDQLSALHGRVDAVHPAHFRHLSANLKRVKATHDSRANFRKFQQPEVRVSLPKQVYCSTLCRSGFVSRPRCRNLSDRSELWLYKAALGTDRPIWLQDQGLSRSRKRVKRPCSCHAHAAQAPQVGRLSVQLAGLILALPTSYTIASVSRQSQLLLRKYYPASNSLQLERNGSMS